MDEREFDVVVWGATGFTGKLVADYLVEIYGVGGDLKWAIAGRNRAKLEAVRTSILADPQLEQLPIIIADSENQRSLDDMAARTRVVCTTVGPYALYGTALVAACVAAGTHYCDLAGEVHWMAKIIATYQGEAEKSGARIVHSCGFDSIPSDMGTWFLQQAMLDQHGVAATQVKSRIGRNRGSASGGTVASMLNMMDEAKEDDSVREAMTNPYSLYPSGTPPGEDGADQDDARFDPDFQRWTSPFIMAAVNTRVVRRSNALLGFPWGEGFRFEESMLSRSRYRATRDALATSVGMSSLALGPVRNLAKKFLPQPGDGPSRDAREAGHYEIFFHGRHPLDANKDMRARVSGDMDPGYGSTSKMLAESAVCLAKDACSTGGGIWTPASAMADTLLGRLQNNAGLTFEILPDPA